MKSVLPNCLVDFGHQSATASIEKNKFTLLLNPGINCSLCQSASE